MGADHTVPQVATGLRHREWRDVDPRAISALRWTKMTKQQVKAIFIALVLVGAGTTYLVLRNHRREFSADSKPAAPKDIVGVYQQLDADPPGTEFRLEIRPEGRWAMANMMTGFWGTWAKSDSTYTFIGTDGATGKDPNPSEVPVRFDGENTISFGPGEHAWNFERMTATEEFVIPFVGTSIEDWKGKKG